MSDTVQQRDEPATGGADQVEFGRTVIGPVVAESCLRLWNLVSLLDSPEDTTMLFCSRGGLRMLAAYERFMHAFAVDSPVRAVPFMTSRVSSVRPALAPALRGEGAFGPAASATLFHDFRDDTNRVAAEAISGVSIDPETPGAEGLTTADGLLAVLREPGAAEARAEILVQAERSARHLREAMDGTHHGMLVDTGLYGSTGLLLHEGFPDLRISSALFAHTTRPLRGAAPVPTVGLIEDSHGYAPWRARSAVLRHVQFFEWLFEPELPSVRRFDEVDGHVVSNLELVDDWREIMLPEPGTMFAGALAYLEEDVADRGAVGVLEDAPRAWKQLSRALVWPTGADAALLDIGARTNDFGRDGTIPVREWRGPVNALREPSVMWREGEIARSGGAWRIPLLAALEVAYGSRYLLRTVRGR